jgi:hypothetical protein
VERQISTTQAQFILDTWDQRIIQTEASPYIALDLTSLTAADLSFLLPITLTGSVTLTGDHTDIELTSTDVQIIVNYCQS